MVEIEISILLRHCLNRRFGTWDLGQQEAGTRVWKRTAEGRTVEWLFTTQEARHTLQRMYPSLATVKSD